ncbi:MAG: SxtJ family membrane protein [Planctomycetota bacterium]
MIKLELNPPESQLRQFGWFALIGFPLATYALSRVIGFAYSPAIYYTAGLGVLSLLLGLTAPKLLKPLFVGLMVVAAPIGFVISWTLMILIWFLLVTPVGLIFRLLGRDPLDKHPDPKVPSYWKVRTKPRSPASYFSMY